MSPRQKWNLEIRIESNKILCILQKLETKVENMEQVIDCGSNYGIKKFKTEKSDDPDFLRKSEFSETELIIVSLR